MSKLFKSKFFLGALVVAVMFVAAFGVNANTAKADTCTITKTLKVGSKGAEVMCLQAAVGATADGAFGPMTKAAVKAWQAAHGLVADGIFGAKSRAAFTGGMTTGGGTGGTLCPNGMTLASNCTQAPGSTTGGLTGTGNGYLTDINSDAGNRVTTVYESDTDKVVAGIKVTARLADQAVTRVRVTFKNASSGSASLSKYASSVSLWRDGTKLATMDTANADRSTSDVFTFNFSNLNDIVRKDDVARYYVSVNGASSIDTNDASGASWTVTFLAAGISAASPDGSYDTYPSADVTQTGLTFAKFASSGVKATVSLASSNPAATTVAVNSTSTPTYGVTLLKFTVKADNTDITIRKVPIQVTGSTTIPNIASTFKLLRGTTVVDSADSATAGSTTNGTTGAYAISSSLFSGSGATCAGTSCGFLFQNLSSPSNKVMAGETAEFSVVADVKGENSGSNFSDGATLLASWANGDLTSSTYTSLQDKNGDQLTANSTVRVGSAVGNTQTFRANGVNVVMGTPSVPVATTNTSGQVTSVYYSIPLSVTSFGNTLYTGQSVQLASSTSASNAFAVVYEASSAPSSAVTTSMTATYTLSTSDAQVESNGYRLDSGATKHFTIGVNLTDPAVYGGAYRVRVAAMQTFTEGGLVTATNNTLVPVEAFRTDFKVIDN